MPPRFKTPSLLFFDSISRPKVSRYPDGRPPPIEGASSPAGAARLARGYIMQQQRRCGLPGQRLPRKLPLILQRVQAAGNDAKHHAGGFGHGLGLGRIEDYGRVGRSEAAGK